MNIKTISTYLVVVILSFNVFTVQAREEPETVQDKTALSQAESPDLALASRHVNSQTLTPASAEKPSEATTALCVYLLIIAVYSIYGFTAGSKDTGN
ncbi:MAG: hypothetical protein ACXWF8_15470 [Methylobacter sp.]